MIPKGWAKKEIGEVCSAIVDCVNKTAPVVEEPTPYKMIRTTNVRHGRVDTQNVRYVTENTFKTWTRRGELEDSDIILTREAPVGEVGQLRNAKGMFLGQRTMVYRGDPTVIDQQFLFQSMISPSLQRQYHSDSAGGTVAHIRVPDCSKFSLAVPPLLEQRKIAEILSTWDAAIEKTEALLATARTQKRALMQSLLTGKRRFPEFEGQPWKEVRLVDVLKGKKVKGKIVPTNYEQVGVPYIGATSFQGDFSAHTEASGAVICEPQDLLVLWDGENAGAVAVGLRGAVSSTVVRFRFDFRIVSASFVCAMMEMNNYQIRAVREGSGIPHMPKDFDHWFVFRLPPLNEQEKIMSAIDAAQIEVKALIRQIEKLRTEKSAMMQQLLTGKRRVVV
jgi:type I restriction enzyme S subunit